MPSIFTRIINGEIPCYKLAEDENYISFLDINPIVKGHSLVIPKVEVDNIFDLDDEILAGLNVFAKKVAKALDEVIPCKRVGMMVIGTEVPHAHLHLIPFNKESEVDIKAKKLNFSKEEMQKIAEDIASAIKL